MKIVDTTNAVKIEIFAPITHPIIDAMNVRAVLRIPFTVGSLEQGSVTSLHFHRMPGEAPGSRTSFGPLDRQPPLRDASSFAICATRAPRLKPLVRKMESTEATLAVSRNGASPVTADAPNACVQEGPPTTIML